jgi:membrane-associated protease RseP (regulator of RpoE activity)
LSNPQKRDLLGQAVAAVITTALIAAPLITSGPDSGDTPPLAALPAQSFAAPVAAVAIDDLVVSVEGNELARARPVRRTPRGERGDSLALAPMAVPPQRVAMAAGVPRALPRKPLSRRLTGWLTGSGTHAVRPFPSVSADRP